MSASDVPSYVYLDEITKSGLVARTKESFVPWVLSFKFYQGTSFWSSFFFCFFSKSQHLLFSFQTQHAMYISLVVVTFCLCELAIL